MVEVKSIIFYVTSITIAIQQQKQTFQSKYWHTVWYNLQWKTDIYSTVQNLTK